MTMTHVTLELKIHRILMAQKLLAAVSKDRKIIANIFSNNQLFDQLIYHLQQTFNHWHIPQNQRFILKMKQCHQARVQFNLK